MSKQADLMIKHKAEACALSCIDFRLVDATVTELEKGTDAPFDYTALPGASLFIVREGNSEWKNTFLQTLGLARALHDINGMVVVQHQNCGAIQVAYPYLVDPKTGKIPLRTEKKLVTKIMKKAQKQLQKLHPDLYYRGYFIYLSGELELIIESPPLV